MTGQHQSDQIVANLAVRQLFSVVSTRAHQQSQDVELLALAADRFAVAAISGITTSSISLLARARCGQTRNAPA